MPEKSAFEVVRRVYLLSQSSRDPATTPDAHFLLRAHAGFTRHWMKTKTYPRPTIHVSFGGTGLHGRNSGYAGNIRLSKRALSSTVSQSDAILNPPKRLGTCWTVAGRRACGAYSAQELGHVKPEDSRFGMLSGDVVLVTRPDCARTGGGVRGLHHLQHPEQPDHGIERVVAFWEALLNG